MRAEAVLRNFCRITALVVCKRLSVTIDKADRLRSSSDTPIWVTDSNLHGGFAGPFKGKPCDHSSVFNTSPCLPVEALAGISLLEVASCLGVLLLLGVNLAWVALLVSMC